MPQRMTIFVSAILVIVLAAVSLTVRTSVAQRAADECITKPSSTAPQGSHWYYRVDRTTHRQCWYLGPEGAKVRARQAGSRMNLSTPRPPQSTAETPTETTEPAASEITSDETASAKSAAGAGVPAAGFSMRWPELPKSAGLIDREPASISNSYTEERAASSQDDMPLTWPVVAPADLPAAARPSQSAVKPELVLALLAGALGLAAIFAGAMFDPSNALRLGQRRLRKLRSSASDASRSGGHVASTFGDPLAAARRVDLASKPVATTHSEEIAREQPKPSGPNGPKRSDAGHDIEASLQRLLNDWRRAAA
jgi:hypothetical protein